MSDQTTQPRRLWVILCAIGSALVTIAMIVVGLVLVDKPHFGWMVGRSFLLVITSGVMVGSLLVLSAAWMLPNRRHWRNILLMVWALIGLTSPFFGYLFLLPWAILAATLPFVIAALLSLWRACSAAIDTASVPAAAD
ncbi:MAG TPA: hypothetical protein VEK79_22705 [Thermoanaerobaculia bacterium]|nr:hypothetical protein [Thermoanaerobaculia bacterium]